MSKVIVRSVKRKSVKDSVREILEELEWKRKIKINSSIVIKLNLNTPDPKKVKSANTSPELIKALCEILLERTNDISLVEAHSYRYSAERAFKNTGIYEIGQKLGIKVVNLSNEPCRDVGNKLLGPLPEILLDGDIFITMPVIKTHALTYFTGSLKNQWGCIPRFDRIALHYALDKLIVELNKIIKPNFIIMDGIVGVEGRGPTNGKARRLDIVLGSDDPVSVDAAAMRLVGLNPNKCRHLVLASEVGIGVLNEDQIEIDMDIDRNWLNFEEAKLDWAVYLMNRLTKYNWFLKNILGVKIIFFPIKALVGIFRKLGVVR